MTKIGERFVKQDSQTQLHSLSFKQFLLKKSIETELLRVYKDRESMFLFHIAPWRATFSSVLNAKQSIYKKEHDFRILEMTYKKTFQKIKMLVVLCKCLTWNWNFKNKCLLCFPFREKNTVSPPHPESICLTICWVDKIIYLSIFLS